MTSMPRQVETAVIRIQNVFLANPSLKLTPSEARRRFVMRPELVDAVLEMLAETGVLQRTADGMFVRATPEFTHRAA